MRVAQYPVTIDPSVGVCFPSGDEVREMTGTPLLFGRGVSAEPLPRWVQMGHVALHRAGDDREVLFPRGVLKFIEYGDG